MGWFNMTRDTVLKNGRMALAGLRGMGNVIAPKLTRRTENWVRSAKPVWDAIGGISKGVANVGDAYASGDLEGGIKAGRKLGYDVYNNAKKVGGAIKSTLGKRKRGYDGPMGRTARGGTTAETGEGGNMPRMSADTLSRINKAARTT